MSLVSPTVRVLTIAGSDSGGGAGIQADLKAFARCGVHGATAITAVTAQSTVGVDAIHPVPPEIVVAQIRSVVADIGVDAIKLGMLGDADTIAAVAGCLLQLPAEIPVVVDPVLVATTGARLLDPDALAALLRLVVPLATVLTPNLPEARTLVGTLGERPGGTVGAPPGAPPRRQADRASRDAPHKDGDDGAAALARALHAAGAGVVVVTGGHRPRGADLYFDGDTMIEIGGGPHHADGGAATHGSGCTHSATLAAQLALGRTPLEAAQIARAVAAEAIGHGLRDVGRGDGPVDALAGLRDAAPQASPGLP